MLGRVHKRISTIASMALLAVLAACNNSPYPDGAAATNTLFNSFDERSPRYLDPTASYSNPETPYTFSAYEPLYGYHYLKRPYELIPKAAAEVVKPYYLDKSGARLPDDAPAEAIAESVYDIPIKKGIRFAPHPAFAKDAQGRYLYHHLTRAQVGDKRSPWDFEQQGTRELVADDYVYAFKRHATTRIETPIFAVFSEYVIGLKEYQALVKTEDAKLLAGLSRSSQDKPFLDFRRWPLEGVQALDPHLLRIRIKGKYPQWKYWLTLTFTSPVPWEADAFYSQPGMAGNGLSLIRWPVGTGPFMMTEYLQDRRHVMKRNPNFHGETYPCEGMPGDKEAGLLADCGKPLPFVDAFESIIIKEKVPRKEMFKQGYLDVPEIERPEWGVEFRTDMEDSEEVRKSYEERGFSFPQTTDINNWYMGFNWLDPVVGKGDTPERQVRNRKLRQALSIAIDWEEGYGQIFRNKGGEVAQGPVPPGVFGSREGTLAGREPGDAPRRRRQDREALDRRGAPADRRGRLPERPRRADRPAARPQLRLPAHADARDQVGARLDGQAVRQARRAARDPRHRLQPVPGQGAQGQAADLLVGVAGRLPRCRELPVPAVRPELEGRPRPARTPPTTATRSTTGCTARCRRSTTGPRSSRSSTGWSRSSARTRPGPGATGLTSRWRSSRGCTTASRASWFATI